MKNLSQSILVLPFLILTACTTIKQKPLAATDKPINSGALHDAIKKVPIRVVAPSSGVELESLAKLRSIETINFDIPDDIFVPGSPYHANSDEERFRQLQEAFLGHAPVVWSLRGGYGCTRLYDLLNTMEKPATPKIFVGYSDSTFLHLFLSRWGWQTIHAAGAAEVLDANKKAKNFSHLFDILSGKIKSIQYGGFKPLNNAALSIDELKSSVIGGNMTILTNSLGTPWQIQAQDKIVLVEDTGTRGYAVDRALNHLHQAKAFKGAAAIIFGSFSGDEHVDYALRRFAEAIDVPVFQCAKFGHQQKNYPLIFNTPTVIKKAANKEGTYTLSMDTVGLSIESSH